MDELKVFESQEFGSVRVAEIEGKTYFLAADIARALGYLRPADAVSAHCKGSVKHRVLTNGGEQEAKFIPEGDIYRLAVHSKLPSAEKFETWVFDEVIPSIRQTGGYHLPQTYAEALRALADKSEEAEKLQIENKEMKPKAEFFDAVADSKDAIEIAHVAKMLNYPGIGRNKLFEILRQKNILDKNNIPYQKYVDKGYFRVIEQKYTVPDGEVRINIKSLVYQKGVDKIRKILEEM